MIRPRPLFKRAARVLGALVVASGVALGPPGCDVSTTEHLIDPDVVPWDQGDAPPDVEPGTILTQLGRWEGDSFVPWPEAGGASLEVINASQGGTWVMPAMRVAGSTPKTIVECTITTDEGERVGRMQSAVKFFPGDPGWLDIEFLPIRIRRDAEHSGQPLEGIFGSEVTFDLQVTDEEGSVGSVLTTVILIPG